MQQKEKSESKRLLSLDAIRGFDMLWIMGGGEIFTALAALTGWPLVEWWAHQLEHVPWHGFVFYDMIFPLFLFIAGISFPFSWSKTYPGPDRRGALYRHIFRRGILLVILGIVYNNAVNFDFSHMRYGSVLGHIGLAWMFAALIFINTGTRFRIIWTAAILVGYWLMLAFFHAPDLGSTDPYSMEGSLPGYIDRMIMPGVLYLGVHDPEGILSTIPAVATALLGMLTGQYIKSDYMKNRQILKCLYMILAGAVLIIFGKIWGLTFPINKNLWTSSFTLFAGGISLILFALFYLVIDVWKFRNWAVFFSIIGLNSITIYLGQSIFNLGHTSNFLFGGLVALFPEQYSHFLNALFYFLTGWIILYFFYRRKIFLKV
jgi:predicted acyltransferase